LIPRRPHQTLSRSPAHTLRDVPAQAAVSFVPCRNPGWLDSMYVAGFHGWKRSSPWISASGPTSRDTRPGCARDTIRAAAWRRERGEHSSNGGGALGTSTLRGGPYMYHHRHRSQVERKHETTTDKKNESETSQKEMCFGSTSDDANAKSYGPVSRRQYPSPVPVSLPLPCSGGGGGGGDGGDG
jgi:hypothetical protein